MPRDRFNGSISFDFNVTNDRQAAHTTLYRGFRYTSRLLLVTGAGVRRTRLFDTYQEVHAKPAQEQAALREPQRLHRACKQLLLQQAQFIERNGMQTIC
ncbi:hypothetical protein FOBRF1_005344 [Fusarium oxysporum]